MELKDFNEEIVRDATNEIDEPYQQRSAILKQLLAVFTLSIGSLISGFALMYFGSVIFNVRESSMDLSMEDINWLRHITPFASLVGSLATCPIIEYLGRKYTIMGTAVSFFIGWIFNASAINVISIGLIFFSLGVVYVAFPIYLVESIQPEIRGALVMLTKLFECIGFMLVGNIANYLSWSNLAFFGAALTIPFFLLMFNTPESPRWYVAKGRTQDAYKALQWLRGQNNIEKEMQDLLKYQSELDKVKGTACCQLFNMKYSHVFLISLGLIFFQSLCGINVVLFYAAVIFSFVSPDVRNASSIVISIISVVGTICALVLVDRVGRKKLLYISSVSMTVGLVLLGLFFYKYDPNSDFSMIRWLPVLCLALYILGYFIGFGPIPWIMIGEILPSKIRCIATSISVGFYWMCPVLFNRGFSNMIESLGVHGTMWYYAFMCLLSLIFVICFVPETRGKTLEQIEMELVLDAI